MQFFCSKSCFNIPKLVVDNALSEEIAKIAGTDS